MANRWWKEGGVGRGRGEGMGRGEEMGGERMGKGWMVLSREI